MSGTVLIYGATGYTGKLIAKVATGLGARPILAARDLEKVQAVAKPLGLACRAVVQMSKICTSKWLGG